MQLLNELVEIAKKATPGRNHDRLDSCGGGLKYRCTGDDGSLVLAVDHKDCEFGFIGPKGEEDERFFLACTPAAILAIAEYVKGPEAKLSNHIPAPEGWKLVPEIPSPEMLIAIKDGSDNLRGSYATYVNLLAAAPEAPDDK